MNKVLTFVRTNILLKLLLILTACVFPLLFLLFFTSQIGLEILNWMWLGFYSCLLSCFVFESWKTKVLLAALNLLPFLFLMFIFLMGGVEAIPTLLLKTIVPFIHIV